MAIASTGKHTYSKKKISKTLSAPAVTKHVLQEVYRAQNTQKSQTHSSVDDFLTFFYKGQAHVDLSSTWAVSIKVANIWANPSPKRKPSGPKLPGWLAQGRVLGWAWAAAPAWTRRQVTCMNERGENR
jgi:hypothetical protein